MKVLNLIVIICVLQQYNHKIPGKILTDDDPWTRIINKKGLEISFLFYSEADNINNGVVIKLFNSNDFPIHYRFTLIFRSNRDDYSEDVEGTLHEEEMQTGSSAGLFWVPFKDGRFIKEVGITELKVIEQNSGFNIK